MLPIEKETNERNERKEKRDRKDQNKQIPLLSDDLPMKGAFKHNFHEFNEYSVDESKYDWRTRTSNWKFKKEFSTEVFEEEDFEYPSKDLKVEFSLTYIGFCCTEQSFTVCVHPNTILGTILNCVLKQPISNYFIANDYLLDETYFDKTLNEVYERLEDTEFEVRIKDWYGRHYMKQYKNIPFKKLKRTQILVQKGSEYDYIEITKRNRELLRYSNPEHPPRINRKYKFMKNVSTQT